MLIFSFISFALYSASNKVFWLVLKRDIVKSECEFKAIKKGCFIPKPNISELIIDGVKKPDYLSFLKGEGVTR